MRFKAKHLYGSHGIGLICGEFKLGVLREEPLSRC